MTGSGRAGPIPKPTDDPTEGKALGGWQVPPPVIQGRAAHTYRNLAFFVAPRRAPLAPDMYRAQATNPAGNRAGHEQQSRDDPA